MTKQVGIIAAVYPPHGVYGIVKDGKSTLPYHVPEDLEHFKWVTAGASIVMGRKTFLSLPGAKPLLNRENIVVTTSLLGGYPDGVVTAGSLEEAIAVAKNETVWIIGGAGLWEEALRKKIASHAWITVVDVAVLQASHTKQMKELLNVEKHYSYLVRQYSRCVKSEVSGWEICFNHFVTRKEVGS